MDSVELVHSPIDRLECVVEKACRLAARNPDVRSVSVVPGRRPTYAQVVRARNLADGCGLDLLLEADGAMALRSRRPVDAAATPAGPGRRREWGQLWNRLAHVGPAWVTTEGVR